MFDIVWSKIHKIYTKEGVKYYRYWVIPKDLVSGFFQFWEKSKIKMRLKGFSVDKNEKGEWVFKEWQKNARDFSDVGRTEEKPIIVPEKSSLEIFPLKNENGLKKWQPSIVAQLSAAIRKYGSAIDGSDTGSGKTYTSVGVARELGLRIGVVCPKAVITSWRRVIENHFNLSVEFIINYESLRTGKHKHIATWVRPNKKSTIEKFVWKIKDPSNVLIIFDESHKLKDGKTQNSEMAISAHEAGFKILCCSATSAINPLELKTIGKILGLHKGTSKAFGEFLMEHDCEHGRFGWEFGGSKNALKKLNFDMFRERGARIKKVDIPDFPDCDIIAESYDMDEKSTSDINRIYAEMENEFRRFEKTLKSDKDKMSNALTIQLRARQKCELLKVPLLVDMANEAIEDGMSVVIIVNFTETIKALSEKLNTNCMIWGGDTENRQKHIDDFQSDKSRIILVNIKAGGAGLSLHDLNGQFPRIALISPGPSAVELKQALGRVWRADAKTKAMQKIIFIAKTKEEEICEKMKIKLDNMDLINDGDLSTESIFKDTY